MHYANRGEREGALPAPYEIKCPEKPAAQTFGEHSEDFCGLTRRKSNGIRQSVKEVLLDFFDRLGAPYLFFR